MLSTVHSACQVYTLAAGALLLRQGNKLLSSGEDHRKRAGERGGDFRILGEDEGWEAENVVVRTLPLSLFFMKQATQIFDNPVTLLPARRARVRLSLSLSLPQQRLAQKVRSGTTASKNGGLLSARG